MLNTYISIMLKYSMLSSVGLLYWPPSLKVGVWRSLKSHYLYISTVTGGLLFEVICYGSLPAIQEPLPKTVHFLIAAPTLCSTD